jgi:phosphoglycolate phosphatase-like HAD superfamily hydrolase
MEFSKIMKTKHIRPLAETISKLDQKTKKQLFKIWDNAECQVIEKTIPEEKGLVVYKKFSPKPKALVTMQGKKFAIAALKLFGLLFDAVLTREDSLDRIEQLRIALEKLNIASPQEILFVGNGKSDENAALMVGCQFLKVGK